MKNKFIFAYSIIASVVLLFSVSFFALNLYKEYSFGESRTNTTFIRMFNHIKAASYQNDLYSDSYSSKLVNAIGNFNDIAFIEIKRDGLLTYPSLSAKNDGSKLTIEYSNKALIRESTLEVEASLYLIKPVSIHYYAKISFLIILIITIITVIMIIYIQMKESGEFQKSSSVLESEDNDNEIDETEVENEIEVKREGEGEVENEIKVEFKDKVENEETEIISADTKPEDNNNTEVLSAATPEAEDYPEADNAADEPEIKTEKVQAIEKKIELPSEEEKPLKLEEKESNEEPKGLFSPITGLGWEQYLITRLENEINRAISSEMDLSLFIIQIPDSVRDSEIIKNTANYLSIQFQFKDLLFEYKDDCLVAMKINMNLDEALIFADKLYADIQNILSVENKKCFIGISTRSIRIVAAERLFTEAEQALEHAKADKDSPIIAFRADTEKYRQYLETNNI